MCVEIQEILPGCPKASPISQTLQGSRGRAPTSRPWVSSWEVVQKSSWTSLMKIHISNWVFHEDITINITHSATWFNSQPEISGSKLLLVDDFLLDYTTDCVLLMQITIHELGNQFWKPTRIEWNDAFEDVTFGISLGMMNIQLNRLCIYTVIYIYTYNHIYIYTYRCIF